LLNVEVPRTALECRALAVVAIVNQKSWRPSMPGPPTAQWKMA